MFQGEKMTYITTASTTTIVSTADGILVQVNAALTGTVTVADGGATVAVITNPTTGGQYRYYGFNGAITVTPSATCDITVSVLNSAR